jgi:hypothetical protein
MITFTCDMCSGVRAARRELFALLYGCGERDQ